MSLSQILQNCAQPATRAAAEQALQEAETNNFQMYIEALAAELVNENSGPQPRSMAGVLIKLALSGQSDAYQQQKAERWIKTVDPSVRKKIKDATVQSLVSPVVEASRAGAQAVAAIAFIELPRGDWPELIQSLTSAAANQQLQPELKVSTLQAIGYICEAIAPECISEAQVNDILTSIVGAMNDNCPEKLYDAATGAMLNTLEFASHNMKKDAERNMILTVIMTATKSKYTGVRTKAYECTVKLASHYYEFLQEYMTQLYESTFATIRQDAEPVAMQAIEFWTTLCEEEIYLVEEAQELQAQGATPERQCAHYINTIGKQLTDLILEECLIKQEEDQDDETRNVATSAALCLGFLCQCLGNDILPFVLPFIEKNINDQDWHKREASVLAFGAMLEGPDTAHLQAPLHAAFETVLSKMLVKYEQHPMVRDTAAWAFSVVCGFHTNLLDPSKHFQPLVKSLLIGLDDEARVARNVAFAIHNLARAFEPVADAPTNQLSGLFQHFITKLLQVTQREDRTEWELCDNAYEAINNLVENAARDMHGLIKKLLEEIVRRLMLTLKNQPTTSDEKEEREQLQMFLCGNLLVIVQKLKDEIVDANASADGPMPIPDRIVELMIEILKIPNAPAHSDAFMVIGAVANAVDDKFARYLSALMPFVLQGLNNHAEYQVCQNAVGVVGDICRTVEQGVDPYCNEVVQILHNNLKDEHLNRDVKPPTLAVFGDIALAIGPNFERFLQECMSTIFAAAQTQIDREDEDMVEYLNTLRESILEACTGIIQGLNGDTERNIASKGHLLNAYADSLLNFVALIASEVKPGNSDVTPAVVKGAVGVVGDLVFVLGQPVKDKIIKAKAVVEPLFIACELSGDKSTVEIAGWAKRQCGL